ncbi:MAG: alpha-galactosidase [Acidobacteria bacterium]|nr:MAG: alpha-galactosidase [Acidobacteriota bacterium]
MRRLFSLAAVIDFALLAASLTAVSAQPVRPVITIKTEHVGMTLAVGADGRLYQAGFGPAESSFRVPGGSPAREVEAYPPYGNGQITEPSLKVIHTDGNTSTDLLYVSHRAVESEEGRVETRIELRDGHYPLRVTLCFRAYSSEDVIEQWIEIQHQEEKPIVLERFGSSSPVFQASGYWLTQLEGNYMREAHLVEERLTPGIKVLDSKLGIRAHQMRNPSFILAIDEPAREESGAVFGASLAWSGSFQFAFDVDWNNRLRAVCGINPLGASYRLDPRTVFHTPSMLWTFSSQGGKGGVTRNFHSWARKYGIRDGSAPRPILLNNWEATYFDFDEAKIVSLFDGARDLGIELFLLDDGWFGNKHPRDNDRAGLGDWQVNEKKLPRGLGYLAAEAEKRGIRFGIWIEPEMVNPASELFEKHPDWVITQAHREPLYGRNQMILDLTRPEVQTHVRKVIDDTFGPNPGIRYTKWDCNRYVTQPGSSYLSPERQENLLVDYQWALYDAMKYMAERYPGVISMVCSGGSGRVDYGALKYFHGFWPSDNTDPVQRVFIQWGFSHFFPAAAISAHVTDMGRRPAKFAVDVALSGAFGIDRDVSKMSAEEKKTVIAGARLYKERLRPLVLGGDLYRLQSPYERPQAALSYVSPDRTRAVVFIYRLGEEAFPPVKPRGLDPAKKYRVREINLPEGARSRLSINDQVVDGATLMEHGFAAPLRRAVESAVIELTEEGAQ